MRRVHWRAYAKTGRLFTRLETAPERARFRIYLDQSPSMRLHGKLPYAREVAALLLRIARQEDPLARTRGEAPRNSARGRGCWSSSPTGLTPSPGPGSSPGGWSWCRSSPPGAGPAPHGGPPQGRGDRGNPPRGAGGGGGLQGGPGRPPQGPPPPRPPPGALRPPQGGGAPLPALLRQGVLELL